MKLSLFLPRSLLLASFATAFWAHAASGKSLELRSADGLSLHHAQATAVTFADRAALQLTATTPPVTDDRQRLDHLALVDGLEFTNGTIEIDVAGQPSLDARGGARGFVGVAFRVQPDRSTYDCFYLRPTNGRAEDQERRNHTAQYIAHPEFTWSKLRQDSPSRYESYVDITPATWIHLKIEIDGDKARLFIDDREQPTLIINDLKSGTTGQGAVALWFEGSTIAHFANLKISLR
jgi:hypothetical protein